MRFAIAVFAAGATALAATGAQAQGLIHKPYFQIDSGASIYDGHISGVTNDFDTGWNISGKLGRRIGRVFREELEVGYQRAGLNSTTASGHLSDVSVMANGYLDLPMTGAWSDIKPYVGVGLGGANVIADVNRPVGSFNDNDWAFAWQAMAGVDVPLTPRSSLSLGYKYFNADTVRLGPSKVDLNSHQIEAGLHFRFGG